MKIAYVNPFDPRDRTRWAGTAYYIAKSLSDVGCEVQYIAPLKETLRVPFKVIDILLRRTTGTTLQRDREPLIVEGYRRQVDSALANSDADVVLSPASTVLCRLRTHLPVVVWHDATYTRISQEYIWETPACARSRRLGMEMDRQIGQRAALNLFASDWAAKSAIDEVGIDPARVRVVPYGANWETDPDEAQVRQAIHNRPTDVCRLLYVGTGWERKGGDLALAVGDLLQQMGVKVELTMLGQDVPEQLPAFARKATFLPQTSGENRAALRGIFTRSHFLLHPARAEAYGIVLCEASGLGVPCLSTRVGGIPTIVKDGVNGYLADKGDVNALATVAKRVFEDPAAYRALAESALLRYREQLNWRVAGATVRGLLEDLLRGGK